MGDGEKSGEEEEEEVAGVDIHLLVDSLARGESKVATSTALHVGIRDIIEPYGVPLKELGVSQNRLDYFHPGHGDPTVGDACYSALHRRRSRICET